MNSFESRMNRFLADLPALGNVSLLWEPRVIESGRETVEGFKEDEKWKRRAVLSSFSLTWFSVIPACFYVVCMHWVLWLGCSLRGADFWSCLSSARLLDSLTEWGCSGCFSLGDGRGVCGERPFQRFWTEMDRCYFPKNFVKCWPFQQGFEDGCLQITWYNASDKRCVDDRDGRQEDIEVFIKKRGGNGIEFTRLGGCALIIFKTNSSVTGSKVSQGFPAKELSGQAAGFGEGNCFWWCGFFQWSNRERHSGGRQTLKEEVKNYFCRGWC